MFGPNKNQGKSPNAGVLIGFGGESQAAEVHRREPIPRSVSTKISQVPVAYGLSRNIILQLSKKKVTEPQLGHG